MNTTKVIIENWPKTNYIPIIIAIIALMASLYSLYLTRKSFIASHRPYVWASSYVVNDTGYRPIPSQVACRVKNSPARILRMEVKINLNGERLFDYTEENLVRFPDEKSEWYFTIGKKSFDKIMQRPDEDKSKLVRIISLEYSSLDGGKIYRYKLEQSFSPNENQWKDNNEEAS